MTLAAESLSGAIPVGRPLVEVVPADVTVEPYESTTSGFLIKPEVMSDLSYLQSHGIDADVIDVAPTHTLELGIQDVVDRQSAAIGTLSRTRQKDGALTAAETLFDSSVHSAGAIWSGLSKRAIALQTLTEAGNPLPHMIAPGIDPAVYREPLFGGRSAADILAAKYSNNPSKAEEIIAKYEAITTIPLEDVPYIGDPADSPYLSFIKEHDLPYLDSRDFLTGVVDSRAVDTRAKAATEMVLEHVLAHPELYEGRELVTASLACGAAGPVFKLDDRLAEAGVRVGKNILVDNDPMALASAVSLGRSHGKADKVDARLEDIRGDLTDFITPHSVDVLDLLGIVDYLPTNKLGYRAAENFLAKVRDIMAPGGIIVAGNALQSRPHQAFFDKVWPKLEQRDPVEMVRIIASAGYDPQQVKVRVPQREGVYGIYGIAIPSQANPELFSEGRLQHAARQVLMLANRFNRY